jgi:hypothetical protein
MAIKLLPASVNPVDPSQVLDVSTSLVPVTPRAIATLTGEIGLAPSADSFARSSSTRQDEAKFIYGTPVEDTQSDETGPSAWEYVSGWAWNHLVEGTAIAHYLSYAASPAIWSGQLVDLYA